MLRVQSISDNNNNNINHQNINAANTCPLLLAKFARRIHKPERGSTRSARGSVRSARGSAKSAIIRKTFRNSCQIFQMDIQTFEFKFLLLFVLCKNLKFVHQQVPINYQQLADFANFYSSKNIPRVPVACKALLKKTTFAFVGLSPGQSKSSVGLMIGQINMDHCHIILRSVLIVGLSSKTIVRHLKERFYKPFTYAETTR